MNRKQQESFLEEVACGGWQRSCPGEERERFSPGVGRLEGCSLEEDDVSLGGLGDGEPASALSWQPHGPRVCGSDTVQLSLTCHAHICCCPGAEVGGVGHPDVQGEPAVHGARGGWRAPVGRAPGPQPAGSHHRPERPWPGGGGPRPPGYVRDRPDDSGGLTGAPRWAGEEAGSRARGGVRLLGAETGGVLWGCLGLRRGPPITVPSPVSPGSPSSENMKRQSQTLAGTGAHPKPFLLGFLPGAGCPGLLGQAGRLSRSRGAAGTEWISGSPQGESCRRTKVSAFSSTSRTQPRWWPLSPSIRGCGPSR